MNSSIFDTPNVSAVSTSIAGISPYGLVFFQKMFQGDAIMCRSLEYGMYATVANANARWNHHMPNQIL